MSLHTAMHTIGVIGAGAWGTALARHVAEKGLTVTLWAYEQEVVEAIQSKRENSLYLPSVRLPTALTATTSLAEAVHSVDALVFAVPSHAARTVLQQIQPLLHETVPLVSATKGIEEESLQVNDPGHGRYLAAGHEISHPRSVRAEFCDGSEPWTAHRAVSGRFARGVSQESATVCSWPRPFVSTVTTM